MFPWFGLGMSNTSIADKIKLSFENKEKEMDEELKLNFAGVSDEDGFDFAGLPNVSTPKGQLNEGENKEQKPYVPKEIQHEFNLPLKPEVMKQKGAIPKMPNKTGIKDSNPGFNLGNNTSTQVYEVTNNVPRIPQFSGDEPPQKGDVSYKEWRFEVQCLVSDPDIKPNLLIQSIRRSLRGTAKTMLIPLGERATVKQILSKLDVLFGEISTNGMIMQEFFNAFQLPGECVTTFGCRLETMLQTAIDNGYLERTAKNDLLRHKFWTSLSSENLKGQTRHKYDSIKNYDKLLLEIRRVEREIFISNSKDRKPVHQYGMSVVEDDLEEKLNKKIGELEQRLEGKMDDKFNKILEKLDGRPGTQYNRYEQGERTNYHRGSRGRGYQRGNFRGNFRGNYSDKRNYQVQDQGQRGYQATKSSNPNA